MPDDGSRSETTHTVVQELLRHLESLGSTRLNLGCGRQKLEDWINVDKNHNNNPDLLWDLEYLPWPLADNSVDAVLACHVLEHISDLIGVIGELWRVCRPGAEVLIVVPYGSSDDAWDAPQHKRSFFPNTLQYFNRNIYRVPGTVGYGAEENMQVDFGVVSVTLVPYPEFLNDRELEWKTRHLRNIIREMRVMLVVRK